MMHGAINIRQDFSHVNHLKELRFYPKDWHNFLKMNESSYLTLSSKVSPLIQKNHNNAASCNSSQEAYSLKTINELSFGPEDTTYAAVQRELRS